MTGVRKIRGNVDPNRHITQGECHAKMKAEIRVMFLQAKEHQYLPVNHQKLLEKHGTNSPAEPSEGTDLANILILDFYPPEL